LGVWGLGFQDWGKCFTHPQHPLQRRKKNVP
jgi:hypothetical protein